MQNMKNNKKLLSKLLTTVILSITMIFSFAFVASKEIDASILDLFKTKVTVTFMQKNNNGTYSTFKQYKIPKGTSLKENGIDETKVEYPTAPNNIGQSETYWYDRDYVLFINLGEKHFNFEEKLKSNITLYPRYISPDDYDKYFDFRVKGKNGMFVKDEYSYYRYYDDSTGLREALNDIFSISDFNKFQIINKYEFVMRNDQVVYQTLDDGVYEAIVVDGKISGTINSDDKDLTEDEDLQKFVIKHSGKNCILSKTDDNQKTYKIGDYYKGTAFDLAIQEAPEGSTIELLRDLYITKPIEIWGNINFDLQGHKILYNENSACLDALHYFDKARKSDLIISEKIRAAIVVANSTTKIYNGTIINTDQSGRGIVDFSFEKGYKATLENLTIDCERGNNEVGVAVEAGYNFQTVGGYTTEEKAGYIDVVSGSYKGNFMNNNNGDLVIYHGVKSNRNFLTYSDQNVPTNVTIEDGYQVWEDNTGDCNYIIDIEAEVESGDTSPKQYRTLDAAINDLDNNNSKKISLLKDINLGNSNYASDGIYNLNVDEKYTIDVNNRTISGKEINVKNGNVTFSGVGYYKTSIYIEDAGTATIIDGHYDQIYNNRSDEAGKEALTINGGHFVNNIVNTDSVTYFNSEDFTCLKYDISNYPYTVVSNSSLGIFLVKNNEENKSCNTFADALEWIDSNVADGDMPTIILKNSYTTNESIKITRPLVIDLNGETLTSTVDSKISNSVGPASIYVDIDNKYEGKDFNIVSNKDYGKFYNKSVTSNTNTVYGIYVKNGNVNIDHVKIYIQPDVCSKAYAIYNNNANSKIGMFESSAETTTKPGVKNKEAVFVYNKGDMVLDYTSININIDEDKDSVIAIKNEGNFEAKAGSTIFASGEKSQISTTKAIHSTGNVYIHGFDPYDGKISPTQITSMGSQGSTYGIYQAPSTGDINKSITVDDGAQMIVQKAKDGRSAYGIYVQELEDESVLTNIYLGECTIGVNAYNKSAFGIQTYGGYVYSGTVNKEAIKSGMFDRGTQVHDDIRAEDYCEFAEITVQGGNNTVGIDCEYGPYDEDAEYQIISQLVNTSIIVDATGSDSYCVVANDDVVGVEIIDGYYRSNVDNRLVTDKRVFCRNGFYNRDVSLNALTNNLCIKLDPAVTHTTTSYQQKDYVYDYTIAGSGCRMFVSIRPEETLKVKISIDYDARMELEPEKYGIQVIYNPDLHGSSGAITSTYKISEVNEVNGRRAYEFQIPFVLIGDDISVSIVSFKDGTKEVEKVIHNAIYSPEKYYYDILSKPKEYSDSVRDLAAASLRLGAASQNCFNHNKQQLVDSGLSTNKYLDKNNSPYTRTVSHSSDLDIELRQPVAVESTSLNQKLDEIIAYYNIEHSLILGTDTTLRTYFSVDKQYNVNDMYTIMYHDFKGNSKELKAKFDSTTTDGKENTYYIDINDINIMDITKNYQLVITEKGNQYNCTIDFSPLDYVVYATSVKINSGVKQETVDLMNAYYQFYLAASKFIN